jgi:hypothetical protein
MLTLFKFLFFFVIATEGSLYLWNTPSPEMMFTDTWSIQEVRLVIIVLSTIALAALHLWKEEA